MRQSFDIAFASDNSANGITDTTVNRTPDSSFITLIRSRNDTSATVFVNSNTGVDITTNGTDVSSGALYIGALVSGAAGSQSESDNFSGKVSEIIVFDRKLKDSEVESVNEYLSKKYSVDLT